MSFSQIGMNLFFGISSDFIRKRLHRPTEPEYANSVTLFIFALVFVTALVLNCILGAQQSEACGYAAVIFFTIARSCGGSFWYMLQYLFFPAEHFGLICGLSFVFFVPFQLANIPMHGYSLAHGTFAPLTYFQAGFRIVLHKPINFFIP